MITCVRVACQAGQHRDGVSCHEESSPPHDAVLVKELPVDKEHPAPHRLANSLGRCPTWWAAVSGGFGISCFRPPLAVK
jgi:hypothetical protein